MTRLTNTLFAAIVGGGLFCLGCGQDGGPPRTVISGTITFAGKPVEKGQIMFVPIKDTKGPRAGAKIVGGNYIVDFKGGVPIGTHRVEIMGFGASAAPAKDMNAAMDDIRSRAQYLPAKYNIQSELQIEVSPGGTREFNFDLK